SGRRCGAGALVGALVVLGRVVVGVPRVAAVPGGPSDPRRDPPATSPRPPLELLLETAARIGGKVQLVHKPKIVPPRRTPETGRYVFRKKIWNSITPWSLTETNPAMFGASIW